MDRLHYCAPALASELGSDPEHTIATRCLNNIPDHLKNTAPARQEDDLRTKLVRGPYLRMKLKEKIPAASL